MSSIIQTSLGRRLSRRRFVQGLAAGAAVTALSPWLSPQARAAGVNPE